MKTVLLIWMLITSDGQPQATVQVEPSIEQCQKDGAALKEQSDALIAAGEAKDYYGICHAQELSDPGKDPRGSV